MTECKDTHIRLYSDDVLKRITEIAEETFNMASEISAETIEIGHYASKYNFELMHTHIQKMRDLCRAIDEKSAVLRMYDEGAGREAADGK